jgi:hypothetical protein
MEYAMRPAIFLSASVPLAHDDRGPYYKTADPFLIRTAVRELILFAHRDYAVVWGGHPAITPMVAAICDDIGEMAQDAVALYQSNFFKGEFPPENSRFKNIHTTPSVRKDRSRSLELMRQKMLRHEGLVAAVFIGGMVGVEEEFEMFCEAHVDKPAIPVASTGGAALTVAQKLGFEEDKSDIDYAGLYWAAIPAVGTKTRTQ